jgi:colicin import membrane protein
VSDDENLDVSGTRGDAGRPGSADAEGALPSADDTADDAAAGDGPGAVTAADRCAWPGCARPRAPGRASGSGRQKEYCLQADPPGEGGGPVHNARNRWAALRNGSARRAGPDGEGPYQPHDGSGREPGAAGSGRGFGPGEQGNGGGGQSAASVRDASPFSSAKRRAGELLEQARRQHAAAVAGLLAERELYQRVGEELAALSDPAALDLEIATIAARAGRQVAQAEQDAADAQRARLAAERERAEAVRLRAAADDAAEQLTEDTAEAERVLAERTAGFERDLADLAGRTRAAEAAGRAARDEAAAVKAAAEASVAAARQRAEQAAAALADALRGAEQARERAGQEVARARDAAAAAEERARQRAAAAQARADDLAGQARADAEREREAAREARDEAAQARAEAGAAGEAARQAQAEAGGATARAGALADELARLRAELGRRDAAHAAELGRLTAAHQAARDAGLALLDAERARARRAEDDSAGTSVLRQTRGDKNVESE